MKFAVLLAGLYLLPPFESVRAENRDEPAYEIQVDAETYDPGAFKKIEGARVSPMPRGKHAKTSRSAIPDKESREAAFAKVKGLEEAIRDFDELSRDKLYVFARTKSLPQLKKTYPDLPERLLADLHKILK